MYRTTKSIIKKYIPTVLSIILFVLVSSGFLNAQNTNSPYSIFGPGELQNKGFALSQGMGGAGIALKSGSSLNHLNPASYNGIDSLRVISELGIEAKYTGLRKSGFSENSFSGNVRYLALGFRYTNWLAGSFGITPFSSVGYNISKENDVAGTGTTYISTYEGSGGISQFYFSNALKINKNLSVGVNASFMFGSLIQEEQITATDIVPQLQIKRQDYLKSLYFDYGIQYQVNLKKTTFSLGATYSPKQKLTSKHILTVTDGTYSNIDGDEYNSNHLVVPEMAGIGIGIQKGDRFTAAFDYEFQHWSGVEYPIQKDGFVNAGSYSFGMEVNPWEHRVVNALYKNLSYRLGVNYSTSYLKLNGHVIDDKSISFGLGIPLPGRLSKLNVAFKYGIKGTIKSSLIKENYGMIQLGFSLNEIWFIRRKYD